YRQSAQYPLVRQGSLENPGPLESSLENRAPSFWRRAALSLDPDNDWLWRMNLRRVEAEVLRDAVLAVSGHLDRALGGPPVPAEQNPDGLVLVSEKVRPRRVSGGAASTCALSAEATHRA